MAVYPSYQLCYVSLSFNLVSTSTLSFSFSFSLSFYSVAASSCADGEFSCVPSNQCSFLYTSTYLSTVTQCVMKSFICCSSFFWQCSSSLICSTSNYSSVSLSSSSSSEQKCSFYSASPSLSSCLFHPQSKLSILLRSNSASFESLFYMMPFQTKNFSLKGRLLFCGPAMSSNSQLILSLRLQQAQWNSLPFSKLTLMSWWSTAWQPWLMRSAIGIRQASLKQQPKHRVMTARQQQLNMCLRVSSSKSLNSLRFIKQLTSSSSSLRHSMRTWMISSMRDLLRPFRSASAQSTAVSGSAMVSRQAFHSLFQMLSLWYMMNTQRTLNQASSEAQQSNRSSLAKNSFFRIGSLQQRLTVSMRFAGTATMRVLGGMDWLVATPWTPLRLAGMVRWGWIRHPFATIHSLRAKTFSQCIYLLQSHLKSIQILPPSTMPGGDKLVKIDRKYHKISSLPYLILVDGFPGRLQRPLRRTGQLLRLLSQGHERSHLAGQEPGLLPHQHPAAPHEACIYRQRHWLGDGCLQAHPRRHKAHLEHPARPREGQGQSCLLQSHPLHHQIKCEMEEERQEKEEVGLSTRADIELPLRLEREDKEWKPACVVNQQATPVSSKPRHSKQRSESEARGRPQEIQHKIETLRLSRNRDLQVFASENEECLSLIQKIRNQLRIKTK